MWFAMWCAPGDVAVGLLGRSGDVVDRIALRCADVLDNGALGSRYTAANVGGNGGFDFALGTRR
ncbi:hypothetical protein SAMN02745121_08943 [Nannocystis exedens]|uniref:Uncharacterized protein n=1 Tax=Nannocystis exedens TaxID=54 RepID=A0A1I2ITT9_9BACT|nr:hypothetical protein NAEX_02476 [Nannocystis exedens]SFF45130.1 hypothetical protein SAMN02745121_08943 [Nannocystis exedens]